MTISEKVAYLKGLADGMELDKEDSKESKLIGKIIDILEDVGLSVEDLESEVEDLGDALDVLSEDVEDLEALVYDDWEDDEDDDDVLPFPTELGDDFFEVECPSCGEDIVIDESALDAGEVACPNCGDKFALGFDMDDLTDDE
jgi:predicted Zn finger-like uncharacterized protein